MRDTYVPIEVGNTIIKDNCLCLITIKIYLYLWYKCTVVMKEILKNKTLKYYIHI